MRPAAAFAGVSAVLTLGSVMATPTAYASVESFLLEVGTPFSTPEEQLAEGNSVCAALTRGRIENLSGPAAAAIIANFSDYNASQGRAGVYAINLMVASVKHLCPENKRYLRAAAVAYDAQTGE